MVRYADPERHPDLPAARRSPGARSRARRARNEALSGAEAVAGARESALRLLDVRARSRGELEGALRERGFAAEAIDQALERLARVGLVDDARFARAFVRERFESRGIAPRLLLRQLRARGVSDADAALALAQVSSDAEEARARELVERRAAAMDGSRESRLRRLLAFLARRGYEPALCRRVVFQVVDATKGSPSALGGPR